MTGNRDSILSSRNWDLPSFPLISRLDERLVVDLDIYYTYIRLI
jgi:hypothetical protein